MSGKEKMKDPDATVRNFESLDNQVKQSQGELEDIMNKMQVANNDGSVMDPL